MCVCVYGMGEAKRDIDWTMVAMHVVSKTSFDTSSRPPSNMPRTWVHLPPSTKLPCLH